MTNKDKFLRDGVSVEEFARDIDKAYNEAEGYVDVYLTIEEWAKQPATPTLTEDERVILRNLDSYTEIGRTEKDVAGYTDVYIKDKNACESLFMFKSNLFQFIKERRRI